MGDFAILPAQGTEFCKTERAWVGVIGMLLSVFGQVALVLFPFTILIQTPSGMSQSTRLFGSGMIGISVPFC